MTKDPRYMQVIILSSLLVYGMMMDLLSFPIWHPPVLIASTLLTQYICSRCFSVSFDYRSPLISALSLSLLLRTNFPLVDVLAGVIAISSKFMLRHQPEKNTGHKHIFNPANLALIIPTLFVGAAWISPGQWGNFTWFAFALACGAMFVLSRAKTWDVAVSFLVFYGLILFARAAWLGDPFTIPLHQMQSGAVLLFAFFMISDPKTAPNSRTGRLLFAAITASIAGVLQFAFFIPLAIMYALALSCLSVPWIDRHFHADAYHWPTSRTES